MEVCAEMASEQAQHRRVVVIDGGSCLWNSSIVLASEAFCQKSHGTGTGSVSRSYEQAGITDAFSLGAMGEHSANLFVVLQQSQADCEFKPAWINRGLQRLWSA